MIIDTHAHLDMKEFNHDRNETIERANILGVKKIVTVGVDLESSEKALALTQKYESVFAAVGIQPEEVGRYIDDNLKLRADTRNRLENLCQREKVVAIGECGLDYKLIKSSNTSGEEVKKEKQKGIFRMNLGLAVLTNLPVIVHNREADEDTLREIRRYKETKRLRGVIHCFTGSLEFAQRIIDLGFLLSFTGIITYPNAQELRRVVKEVPLDKIMVETDAPLIAPQAYRGQRNEPAYVIEVVKKIAEIKNLKFEEICLATSENARGLFRM